MRSASLRHVPSSSSSSSPPPQATAAAAAAAKNNPAVKQQQPEAAAAGKSTTWLGDHVFKNMTTSSSSGGGGDHHHGGGEGGGGGGEGRRRWRLKFVDDIVTCFKDRYVPLDKSSVFFLQALVVWMALCLPGNIVTFVIYQRVARQEQVSACGQEKIFKAVSAD